MAFAPEFSASQTASSPGSVVFEDTSTGTDALIMSRVIFVTDCNGNYIVPTGTVTNYISWILATNPISVANLLTEDKACNVTVQWLDTNGVVLYTKSHNFSFSQFNKQFYYYLLQQLALKPITIQDDLYHINLIKLWNFIIGADNAVTIANDISNSQNMLNNATEMSTNQNNYF